LCRVVGTDVLNISGNSIVRVDVGAASCLLSGMWRSIDISHNSLASVTFSSSSSSSTSSTSKLVDNKLVELILSHNKIKSVENEIFLNLVKLARLDLSCNQLQQVDLGELLASMPALVEIRLSRNQISHVYFSTSSKNSCELTKLDLSYNRIEIIDLIPLAALRRLETLDLSGNLIRSVTTITMASTMGPFFPSIQIIYLNSNRLESATAHHIAQMLLQRACTLNRLELNDNAFVELDVGMFNMRTACAQMKALNFARMPSLLGEMDPDALYFLLELDLSAASRLLFLNKYKYSMFKLASLNLAGNNLSRLDMLPIGALSNLRILDLTSNALIALVDFELSYLAKLEEIRLERNLIGRVEPNAFAYMSSLRVLKVSRNRIKYLPTSLFAHLHSLRRSQPQ
jgi:Leucine-rich repeat (LRR) protein